MLREDRISLYNESKDITIERFGSTDKKDLIGVTIPSLGIGSAAKYTFKFRGVRVTTIKGLSKNHVLKWLRLLDQYYDRLEKEIFKISAELLTSVKKKNVSVKEVQKAVDLDHVQVDKKDIILGYNTTKDTILGTKYSIIVLVEKSFSGIRCKVVLDEWKK